MKPAAGSTRCHSASSSRPSMTGGSAVSTAVSVRRASGDERDRSCAAAGTAQASMPAHAASRAIPRSITEKHSAVYPARAPRRRARLGDMDVKALADLNRHMAWADATVWSAVLACDAAHADARIRELLYHIHMVQRAFLRTWRN